MNEPRPTAGALHSHRRSQMPPAAAPLGRVEELLGVDANAEDRVPVPVVGRPEPAEVGDSIGVRDDGSDDPGSRAEADIVSESEALGRIRAAWMPIMAPLPCLKGCEPRLRRGRS